MVTAEDRQGFLLSLFWEAQDKDATLYAALQAIIRDSFKHREAGHIVIATSGNGRSTSLLMPDFLKTFTPDEARRMWVGMWNVYQAAIVTLGITAAAVLAGTDNSQDQNIVNAMVASDNMQHVTHFLDDFTALREPSFGPAT